MPLISFRPLRTDDLDMLVGWFADPVVARWWDQPADRAAVEAKYGPRIAGTGDPTAMWIAEVDGEPAGLLQNYLHSDSPETDAAVGVPTAVGIDYLLGAAHRGRGLGGPILRAFAGASLIAWPGTTVCVAAPAQENRASCAALERAGFVRGLECRPPHEPPAVVYTIGRDDLDL